MAFRYIVQTQDKTGHLDEAVQSIPGESFTIGRGGRSEVLLHSRLVSLEHAKLSIAGDKLLVEDLGSFSGLRVNDVLANKITVDSGSIIKLGDVELRVERDTQGWSIIEKREEVDTTAEERLKAQLNELQVANHFPSFRTIAIVLMTLIAGWFFGRPYLQNAYWSWSSGPVSNQHAMIEKNCQACHSQPFTQVQDKECLACHKLTEHSEAMPYIVKEFRELNWRCAQCHMEHNGNHHLTVTEANLCTTCHAQLTNFYKDSKKPNIVSFKDHAQFAVGLKKELVEGRYSVVKVSLDDKKNLIDPTHIKLNHQVHLKVGLKGPKGPTKLECADCHKLAEDKRGIVPITFEKDCQSCHPLTFDDRLPEKQVPHGEPDVVFNYLYAEYAKLFLADQGTKAAEIVVQRFKPGRDFAQPAAAAPAPASDVKANREKAEQASRSSEKLLFTKTACLLCHDVSEKVGGGLDSLTGGLVSKFKVLNPEIPMRWMPGSIFSHGAHQELRCDGCHVGVDQSQKTSDVLMPGIEGCRDCHADPGPAGKVRSECVMCHSYHEPLLLEEGTKRHIEQVLYGLDVAKKK